MLRTCLLLTLWMCQAATAGQVRVAVAANFAAPLAALAPGFKSSTGHSLTITAGATGKFYSQIKAGAPFDVLLAADQDTPQKLVDEGLAVTSSRFTYARGRLVLWSATPGLVDNAGAVLEQGPFAHLAIANPKTAPYGRAAVQALQALGLQKKLAPKLVVGESVAQAYQFVFSGNAELGLVALSQVKVPGSEARGNYWLVPARLHAPIAQDALMLSSAADKTAASALLSYLRGAPAQQLLRRWGYE
jgi:molybdate transport system substrate-binding protein